ncbi:MAG: hypothetical protein GVY26_01110 [Bacteroidetes bacterium]|nr:hypothetical protein [Bacteroidota bacterium]
MEIQHWIKWGLGVAMLYTLHLGCGPAASHTLPDNWVLADSGAAAKWIQRDSMTPFFQQIGTVDMRLQMGQAAPPDTAQRDQVLKGYRQFLARQARSFQPREKQLLREVLTEAREMVSGLNPNMLPSHLRLVKISGKAYGPAVYYTRENCIMIPQNELHADNRSTLRRVLLHELFHIYSRYHPQLRRELYALIGFHAAQDSVVLPGHLRKRQLLNPDGVRWQQKIRLKPLGADSSQAYFPIIYAEEHPFAVQRPFMDYLAFGFFRADSSARGWIVREAPTPVSQLSDFHQKTGGNTDYIIHPDEILADNFVLLVYRLAGLPADVDEDGRRILDQLQHKLQ